MSLTKSTTDISVHQKLSDNPNQEDGLTAEQLKAKFDFPAETLQTDLNRVIGEIEAQSGASNIGTIKLSNADSSDNNIQSKLQYLFNSISETSSGSIADGSVTRAKMADAYANTIAIKDGNIQTGLNSEKVGGKTYSEVETTIKNAIFSVINNGIVYGNKTVASKTTENVVLGFKPGLVILIGAGDIVINIKGKMEATVNAASSVSLNDNGFAISSTYTSVQNFSYVAFKEVFN